MPRHNRTPPHQPYDPTPLAHSQPKRAFRSKQEAERAVREIQKYNIEIELSTYRSPTDGKWYLSSRHQDTSG